MRNKRFCEITISRVDIVNGSIVNCRLLGAELVLVVAIPEGRLRFVQRVAN